MSIKSFNQFLNEALKISQYREHAFPEGRDIFNRKRYEKIFKKYKEKYSGDRNAFRIYLPLIEEDGKKSKTLMVCVSRHPYDIIGSDTDREWNNCMTLPSGEMDDAIKELEDYIEKAGKRLEEIGRKIEDKEKEIRKWEEKLDDILTKIEDTEDRKSNKLEKKFLETVKKLKSKETQLNDKIDKLDDEKNKLEYDYDDLLNDIDNSRYGLEDLENEEGGENVHFLKKEVEFGSLISYLIKKKDKNINKPLAVLNIKPYIRDKKTYLKACRRSYGIEDHPYRNFIDTVNEWLADVNKGLKGQFNLHPEVYNDADPASVNIE